ncbi:MAG TPA: hypothetical protein PKD51_09300 [Saprospiraceae bacterium]|nr:hypothetical protein [Saprospiraceae bacterium]
MSYSTSFSFYLDAPILILFAFAEISASWKSLFFGHYFLSFDANFKIFKIVT